MQILTLAQLVPSTVTRIGSRVEVLNELPKRKPIRTGRHCDIVIKKPVLRPAKALIPEVELPRLMYLVLRLLSKRLSGTWPVR